MIGRPKIEEPRMVLTRVPLHRAFNVRFSHMGDAVGRQFDKPVLDVDPKDTIGRGKKTGVPPTPEAWANRVRAQYCDSASCRVTSRSQSGSLVNDQTKRQMRFKRHSSFRFFARHYPASPAFVRCDGPDSQTHPKIL